MTPELWKVVNSGNISDLGYLGRPTRALTEKAFVPKTCPYFTVESDIILPS